MISARLTKTVPVVVVVSVLVSVNELVTGLAVLVVVVEIVSSSVLVVAVLAIEVTLSVEEEEIVVVVAEAVTATVFTDGVTVTAKNAKQSALPFGLAMTALIHAFGAQDESEELEEVLLVDSAEALLERDVIELVVLVVLVVLDVLVVMKRAEV